MNVNPVLNGQGTIPSISVVIPAYNAERTIVRTLESVVAQTFPARDVIVVDDGSSDHTREVVQEFGHNVTVVSQANGGPNSARNHGIRRAKGEWIALLDADDAWLPEKLERQAAWLNHDYDLVRTFDTNAAGFQSTQEVTFDLLWKQNFIATSSVVVRKRVVEDVGGFIEDRRLIGAEDYNLWLRLAARGLRSRCVPEPLVEYTPAGNSLSSQIEKVLAGELYNIELLRGILNLADDVVRAKQTALYDEYSMSLLHQRDLPAARRCFRAGFRNQFTCRLALGWMATFLPTPLLNLKRWATAK